MRGRKLFVVLFAAIMIVSCAGCGGGQEPAINTETGAIEIVDDETPTPTSTPSPASEPTPEPISYEGMTKSTLTGEYIDDEIAETRPVAVVINNMIKALPQSGLSKADILYEVLTEGEITRLVAIFQSDFTSEKIGPVRSARHYFLDIAEDSKAVFVHHGRSTYANTELSKRSVNNLDGMYEAAMFWRDPVRVAQAGMYEHSSYTNAERAVTAIAKKGYSSSFGPNPTAMFNFYDEFTPITGSAAEKVNVPFSKGYYSTLTYNAEDNLYYKQHSGKIQIDEETGEQLAFSNMLIQITTIYVIPGDPLGCREVQLYGTGSGYYICGGKYVPVTWEKADYRTPTEWFDANGDKLTINPGKTFIAICDKNTQITFE